MRSPRIPKMVTPRMSRRVPSARVPCQCHSAQPVSPCHAERSSSARKSGTPAKISAQFCRTCWLPTKARSGCRGCWLPYAGSKQATKASRSWRFWASRSRSSSSVTMISPPRSAGGEVEQVPEGDVARLADRGLADPAGWLPGGLHAEVRGGVAVEEADQYLGHDAAADRAQAGAPLGGDLRLLEDVVPEGGVVAEGRGLGRGQGLGDEGAEAELLGGQGRDAHHPGHRLAGGQAPGLASEQVEHGQLAARGSQPRREQLQGLGQPGVELAAELRGGAADGDELAPLDGPAVGQPAEAAEVAERPGGDRVVDEGGDVQDVVVEVVAGPDHRVAEPECRRRELDRHERLLLGLVEQQLDGGTGGGALVLEDAVDHGGPADPLEEVVHDHPLVVPADPAPRLL